MQRKTDIPRPDPILPSIISFLAGPLGLGLLTGILVSIMVGYIINWLLNIAISAIENAVNSRRKKIIYA